MVMRDEVIAFPVQQKDRTLHISNLLGIIEEILDEVSRPTTNELFCEVLDASESTYQNKCAWSLSLGDFNGLI
jgi:hypothetical protein